jgi:hypothetical protein
MSDMAKPTQLTQNGREYDLGDAIQHPEWAFRVCGDVVMQV